MMRMRFRDRDRRQAHGHSRWRAACRPTRPARRLRAACTAVALAGGTGIFTAFAGATAAPVAAAAPLPQASATSCAASLSSTTPVIGTAQSARGGYWEVDQAGQVAALGGAPCLGSAPAALNQPIVGMAATPDGNGYWLVAADGGIFTFGDAGFYGSKGGEPLNQPIVGMAATPDGHGYWLVAADGGIFTFGDAGFYGSMGGSYLNQPVVGMAATPDGHGYWLVARDGGIFTFGDGSFYGSMGGQAINSPVVGMGVDAATGGYWELGADGGIYSFNAPFHGSAGSITLPAPATAITPTLHGNGYRFTLADGTVKVYGSATFDGQASLPAGTTLRCLASQIGPYIAASSGGVGNIAQAIGLTNTSRSTCVMGGYPGTGLLDSHDALLPVSSVRGPDYLFGNPPASTVTLVPGQEAYFDIGYTDMPLGQPTTNRLEIIVPNGTNPIFFPTYQIRAYPNPDHINVNAVHAAPPFAN